MSMIMLLVPDTSNCHNYMVIFFLPLLFLPSSSTISPFPFNKHGLFHSESRKQKEDADRRLLPLGMIGVHVGVLSFGWVHSFAEGLRL